MILHEYNFHMTHGFRVGNVGSLSWFATVHLEFHVSFTSSYGLTLGFMVLSFLMVVFGKHCYGTKASLAYLAVVFSNTSQYKLSMSTIFFLKQQRYFSVPAEMASRWHTQIPHTSLRTAT
jgi:hypothetical protein